MCITIREVLHGVDTPNPAFIDLGIASAVAIAVAPNDSNSSKQTAGALAVAGVFALSGVVGAMYAYRCKNRGREQSSPAKVSKPKQQPVPLEGPVLPLRQERLSPGSRDPLWPSDELLNSQLSDEKEPIRCNAYSNSDCPHMHLCVPVDGSHGFCQPIGEESTPKNQSSEE